MTVWICQTCAVEHDEKVEVCAICADERQWVPRDGQHWTSLDELRDGGTEVTVEELEPDLYAVEARPGVGIAQQAKLVRTPAGSLLWDPTGYADEAGAALVREHGAVLAIAASHPHMFGVQVEWSRLLGGVPVLVAEPDLEWVARRDDAIKPWKEPLELAPGLRQAWLGALVVAVVAVAVTRLALGDAESPGQRQTYDALLAAAILVAIGATALTLVVVTRATATQQARAAAAGLPAALAEEERAPEEGGLTVVREDEVPRASPRAPDRPHSDD